MCTKQQTSSCHMFCEAFNKIGNNTNVNQHSISIIEKCTKLLNIQSNYLILLSLALRNPIAQFFVDIYFQCVFKDNSTINTFMEKSKFLSMLSHNTTPWRSIRKHLSEFLKCIYVPIADHENNQICSEQNFNMSRILYYTSVIHENIYILNKVSQIDTIFIPQVLSWINDEYFAKFGITYEKFNLTQGMKQMMRPFNDTLKQKKFKRCVILIMVTEDIYEDIVYIFEPLTNNSLCPEIYNYTEIEWFCNTKAHILPDLSPNDHNALCLSFHKHVYHNNSVIERVYLSYGNYGCRIFKYNFVDILKLFCAEKDEHPMIDWEDEIKHKEFKDSQFDLFVNMFFADFKLKQPNIDVYLNENLYDSNEWNRLLYQCVHNDKQLSVEYTYVPSPMRYYEYINIKIGEYYKSMNKVYSNQFIQFIYDNELEDYELVDNLGQCVDVNDCVLLDFDTHFPMHGEINISKDEFIFNFLKKYYFYEYVCHQKWYCHIRTIWVNESIQPSKIV